MTAVIMKRILCAFFTVLTYITLTGGIPTRQATLNEMINYAKQLKEIGKDTGGLLHTPVNIELNCSLLDFKNGLHNLKTKWIGTEKQSCVSSIKIIERNMRPWKVKKCPKPEYEEKNVAEFMDHLILFLQKMYKSA